MVGLKLDGLDLSSLARPFRSIWTYGSDWSHARILATSDQDRTGVQVPLEDSEDLKFEIQYQASHGLAYIGVARGPRRDTPLPKFAESIQEMVWGELSAEQVLRNLLGDRYSQCVLQKCVFGVAHAWLEHPRFNLPAEVEISSQSISELLPQIAEMYPTGAINPIMCELVDPVNRVWIANQASSLANASHHVTSKALELVVREIFLLS